MGGTVLTNYVAKTGKKTVLSALVIVSSPLDCLTCAQEMRSWKNFLGFFDFLILNVLKKLVKNCENELKTLKNKFFLKGVDLDQVRLAQSCIEFDDLFTAPMNGMRSFREYYAEATCAHLLKDVEIPFMALHAKDDPIVSYLSLPKEEFFKSKKTVLVLMNTGGHVGFFKGYCPPKRWFQVPIIEFLINSLE
jgi:predicted alpha/beta-fold hydrolase